MSGGVITGLLLAGVLTGGVPAEKAESRPQVVGHRGLIRHGPENTLANFRACLALRVGFEVDVRRSKDGVLVCVHDATVDRTTDGKGKVADLTLAELRRLDAGGWFDPAFAGERIPTLEEVLALLAGSSDSDVVIALDIKVEDAGLAGEVVSLARKHRVTERLVCIGLTISDEGLRTRLRQSDAKIGVAALANTADELRSVLGDGAADWAYVRFVPTAAQVGRVHAGGKRVFIAGPTVSGSEPENWRRVRAAGVDAMLTDYPLECLAGWRQ